MSCAVSLWVTSSIIILGWFHWMPCTFPQVLHQAGPKSQMTFCCFSASNRHILQVISWMSDVHVVSFQHHLDLLLALVHVPHVPYSKNDHFLHLWTLFPCMGKYAIRHWNRFDPAASPLAAYEVSSDERNTSSSTVSLYILWVHTWDSLDKVQKYFLKKWPQVSLITSLTTALNTNDLLGASRTFRF